MCALIMLLLFSALTIHVQEKSLQALSVIIILLNVNVFSWLMVSCDWPCSAVLHFWGSLETYEKKSFQKEVSVMPQKMHFGFHKEPLTSMYIFHYTKGSSIVGKGSSDY